MDIKALSSNIASFAFKFCNALDKDKSVVSSPLSAEFVLALLTLAADDPAHSELLAALDMSNNDAIRSSFSALTAKLTALKRVTLNVANQVYVNEGPYELDPCLQEDAVKIFDAGIEKIDFSKTDAAAKQINEWVENKTNKKIRNLISPDSLPMDTRLIFVNALYFLGNWQLKFNPRSTTDQTFHITSDQKIQVPMMHKHAYFMYTKSEGLDAQLLQMHYQGGEASMAIILPQKIDGLHEMMQKLANGYDLMTEIEQLNTKNLVIFVPKFKIETQIDLKELFPKLGIKSIFKRQSSGINKLLNPPETLYVAKAIQRVFIEVNEMGTEASAATYGRAMLCKRPPVFRADRPFLYLVLGPASHVLFIGVYNGK